MDKQSQSANPKPEIYCIFKKKTTMSTAKVVISGVCSKPCSHHSSHKKPDPENISFSSHASKSRISIMNPSMHSKTRPGTRIQAFYAPVETEETLYQVLGIPETGVSSSDVKKAYKQMARKYHPDVSPPDRVDEFTRRFILVHEAYETLSDPQSKAMYDRDLAVGGLGSARKHRQRTEETGEWKMRWQSQLDELKRRQNGSGGMSWGARMRSQRT